MLIAIPVWIIARIRSQRVGFLGFSVIRFSFRNEDDFPIKGWRFSCPRQHLDSH